MSAAAALLSELAERGIRVEPRPGGKLYVAPRARVTPEVIEKIQKHKPALLVALGAVTDRERDSERHSIEMEVKRIAELDAERRERDRIAKRGYDHECICAGQCRWCQTVGVVSCGACEGGTPEFGGEDVKQASKADTMIRTEVARIESAALTLGWTRERLWGPKFWPIRERGLVALLEPNDRLTLYSDHIEITKSDGKTQRLWLQEA